MLPQCFLSHCLGPLERLSTIGGEDDKNTERDLYKALEKGIPGLDISTHLHLHWIENLPVEFDESEGPVNVRHPIFFPHEILHAIHESDVADLVMLDTDGVNGIRNFWEKVRECSWAKSHPAQHYDLDTCCPVGIHGDDVGTTKQNKMLVLSVSSLLSRAESLISRLAMTVILMEICIPGVTLRILYETIAWSFHWALLGIFPPRDPNGNPWPPGSWRANMAYKQLGPLRRS